MSTFQHELSKFKDDLIASLAVQITAPEQASADKDLIDLFDLEVYHMLQGRGLYRMLMQRKDKGGRGPLRRMRS